jgi:integrase
MASLTRPRGRDVEYFAIQYVDGGVKRYVTLGQMPLEDAEQALREFEARQVLGIDPVPERSSRAPRLDRVIEELYTPVLQQKAVATQSLERYCFGHIVRLWPGITLDRVTPTRIERYKAARLREGAKSRTINLELRALRNALKAAEMAGYLPDGLPTINNLRVRDAKPHVFLTLEQGRRLQEELLAMAGERGRLYPSVVATLVGLHTGMRTGEILTREVQDLDWSTGAHGVIRVGDKPSIDWRVKTGRSRIVPMTGVLAREIRAFLQWRGDDDGWLFRRGCQGFLYQVAEHARQLSVERPMTVMQLAAELEEHQSLDPGDGPWSYRVARAIQRHRRMFYHPAHATWRGKPNYRPPEPKRLQNFSGTLTRACKQAKVIRLHKHALRHTWATLALGAGMDLRVVQELGGWSTPDVPMKIYLHVASDHALAAVDKFPLGGITCSDVIVLYGAESLASREVQDAS